MDTRPMTSATLAASVIAVPPVARDANLTWNKTENAKLIRHIEAGGIRTLLYGGNAALAHVAISEYAALLNLLAETVSDQTTVIPSVGPTYGMMMDQATILRDFRFPTVMVLPSHEATTPAGIATGIRSFVDRIGRPVVLYLKQEETVDVETVRRMLNEGLIAWIKYGIARGGTHLTFVSRDRDDEDVAADMAKSLESKGFGLVDPVIMKRYAEASRDFMQSMMTQFVKPENLESIREMAGDADIQLHDSPPKDFHLGSLIDAVGPSLVVSGLGEQPAIVHLRDYGLIGYTSGCACVAPKLSTRMLHALKTQDYESAERIREKFESLETFRDGINPVRVLHAAVTSSGIADMGQITPFWSPIGDDHEAVVRNSAIELLRASDKP